MTLAPAVAKRVGFVLTWARSKAFRTAAGRAYKKKKGVCFTTKSNATGRGTFCYTFPRSGRMHHVCVHMGPGG